LIFRNKCKVRFPGKDGDGDYCDVNVKVGLECVLPVGECGDVVADAKVGPSIEPNVGINSRDAAKTESTEGEHSLENKTEVGTKEGNFDIVEVTGVDDAT